MKLFNTFVKGTYTSIDIHSTFLRSVFLARITTHFLPLQSFVVPGSLNISLSFVRAECGTYTHNQRVNVRIYFPCTEKGKHLQKEVVNGTSA